MAAERNRRWAGIVAGVILLIVLLGVIALLFINSGIYDVAATYRDPSPVAWVLSNTMDNSVKRHARGIKAPALDKPAMVQEGLSHYKEMCVMCHGAPGVRIGDVGRGLNPDPPELTDAAKDWTPAELFWITKHGVRMTGMPAWGVTTSDKEIWSIVALLKKLPSMSPAEYKALSSKAPPMAGMHMP